MDRSLRCFCRYLGDHYDQSITNDHAILGKQIFLEKSEFRSDPRHMAEFRAVPDGPSGPPVPGFYLIAEGELVTCTNIT